ncbi:MAG TPA: carboxypeptidase regulatory-like domain-containing protein, partial [Longimicrobiaceae bacterium]|nr:carboxypeptidase regulatory-like domain-containing protein [Longimicrobiaceae bacterium]
GAAAVRVEAPGASVRTTLSLGSEPVLQDFAVGPQPASAAAGARAAVSGRVVRGAERQPVAGATVRVGGGAAQTTDAQGRFSLRELAAGTHAVTVAHPQHGTRAAQVEVEGGAADVELRLGEGSGLVAMVTVPYTLDPLRVEGRAERRSLASAGFYERREAGFGYFLTEEQFSRAAPLSSALRRVPGLRVNRYYPPAGPGAMGSRPPQEMRVGSGRSAPISLRTTQQEGDQSAVSSMCFLPIIVDGVLAVAGGMEAGHDIDRISMTDVVAIEVYRTAAEIPAQFAGYDRGCGVVLIWTQAEATPSTGR